MALSTSYRSLRSGSDHFEPSESNDPKTQRQLHATLEQIDYTAYAANRREVADSLGKVDTAQLEKLANAAARARCKWIAAALSISSGSNQPNMEQIKTLSELRNTYDELTLAYDAVRRLVERSYLAL
jgi:tryptophanase